ncbi:S8 family serine peptidase [Streptomyces sp. LN785]|uniref:S8 family serine peptidase n=1 Tax=Streptomyces sp. LN785 TaxID=3112983 RepID=UPI003712B781
MPSISSRRTRLAALGIAAVLLPLSVTTSAGAQPPPRAEGTAPAGAFGPAAAAAQAGPRTVTLITGDKVVVTPGGAGAGTASVSGPHGEPIAAYTSTVGKDLYVYPESASPYVSAGILDKELFNVTQLVSYGYDDARMNRLPLIVTYTGAAAARARTAPRGASRVRGFSSINGAALAEDHRTAPEFWSAVTSGVSAAAVARSSALLASPAPRPALAGGISKIWLDGKAKATLADSTAQIGAPEVWSGGNTGKGVDVAVLDTGIDAGHPDLVGQVAEASSFVPESGPGDGPLGHAASDTDVVDRLGHGTHVASTVAGTGAASDGKEKGVAPGARLHVGKVLGDDGAGQTSWILAGMEWAARDAHAKVISMSLGSSPTDGSDPLSQAVNALSAETGTLFTVAAGNWGPDAKSIGAPGAADAALTVGAVDGDDRLAPFSSRGPRWLDGMVKPEITAPGVGIVAANSRYAGGTGEYVAMSGTSMATPHVAGAAALLAAEHPDWTGQQLKDALVSTSKATPAYTAFQAGAGRVDIAAAARASVYATGTVNLGEHAWPADPGATVTEPVTYTNTGNTPVTLNLTVSAPKAPAGLFALSKRSVTVPAHGTATATVSADVDKAARGTTYDARVDAVSAGTRLAHTAVGFTTANQTFELTIVPKDRSGAEYRGPAVVMGASGEDSDPLVNNWAINFILESPGTMTLELPAGTWSLAEWMQVEGAHGPQSRGHALLAAPQIELDRDRTVVLDARKAREMRLQTPRESETTAVRVDYTRTFPGVTTQSTSFTMPRSDDSVWAQPTAKVTEGTFGVRTRWRNEQPAMKISSGRDSFDNLLVRRGTRPLSKGSHRMKPVYVGQGAAADYEGRDVHGKAVVADRNEDVPLADQAAAAAGAGADLLLVVNDRPGRLEPLAFGSITPLTIATLDREQGRRLIARAVGAGRPLDVYSDPTTEYLYDVVRTYHNEITADLTYRPRTDDLARIDMSFRNYRPAQASDYRFDVWAENDWWALGTELPGQAQGDRIDYVSADVRWRQTATVTGETRIVAADKHYAAGSRTSEKWFSPIQRPRISYDGTYVSRQADAMWAFIPGWGDAGADRESFVVNPDVRTSTSIYQGDTLLAQAPTYYTAVTGLKPGRLPYRIVSDNSRGTWTSPYSTTTRTVWSFTSGATASNSDNRPLPLVQLDYDVDTDFSGRAHRDAQFTVRPARPGEFPTTYEELPPARFRNVTLQLSYDDGATWHRASLTRTRDGHGWRTRLDAPRSARFVTVRASARDIEGNAVTQSITRAFGLK